MLKIFESLTMLKSYHNHRQSQSTYMLGNSNVFFMSCVISFFKYIYEENLLVIYFVFKFGEKLSEPHQLALNCCVIRSKFSLVISI